MEANFIKQDPPNIRVTHYF